MTVLEYAVKETRPRTMCPHGWARQQTCLACWWAWRQTLLQAQERAAKAMEAVQAVPRRSQAIPRGSRRRRRR